MHFFFHRFNPIYAVRNSFLCRHFLAVSKQVWTHKAVDIHKTNEKRHKMLLGRTQSRALAASQPAAALWMLFGHRGVAQALPWAQAAPQAAFQHLPFQLESWNNVHPPCTASLLLPTKPAPEITPSTHGIAVICTILVIFIRERKPSIPIPKALKSTLKSPKEPCAD